MDVFDLQAKIRFDDGDFTSGLSAASGVFKGFSDLVGSGISAISSGLKSMVSDSVSSFAEFEQLVGGVNTIFEDLGWDVQQNAEIAFKTAGLSINQYLSAAMDFSASLNQSLQRTEGNIARAAELTDTAIIDMSDNVNKMGSTMESVQNAYKGFSRGNFMMLDNLKLGYGGTKAEMERLLVDAEKISGIHYDIANFSDMIQAIHVIQQNMGITGTTAAEAADTISGSAASMGAAWDNLKLALSRDDADISQAFANVAEAAETSLSNKMPRIEQALQGVSELATQAAPQLSAAVSKLAPQIVPALFKAGTATTSALAKSMVSLAPAIITTGTEVLTDVAADIISNLPQIFDTAGGLFSTLGEAVMANVPALADAAKTAITTFSGYLRDNLPALIPEGVNAVVELAKGITSPEVTGTLINAAFDVVGGLIDGFTSSETINAIIDGAPVIVENIAIGIVNAADKLAGAALQLCGNLLDYFGDEENRKKLLECADKILGTIAEGFSSLLGTGAEGIYNLGGKIAENLGMGEYWQIGNKAITEWWDGFKNKWDEFKSWWNVELSDVFSPTKLAEKIKEGLRGIGEVLSGGVVDKQDENGHGGGGYHSSARATAGAQYDYSDAVIIEPYKESVLPNEYRLKHGDLEARKRATYHADGAIIKEPLSMHVFGEAGREAVLPLDSNTSWMDTLANKIGNRNTTVNIYHTGSLNDEADFDSFIEKLDNALANRYIGQDRSIGVTLA